MNAKEIFYSNRYEDDQYEYRHVVLPKEMIKAPNFPRKKLLTEQECRAIGVQQSPGWVHYMLHEPEPHILLFRRELSIYAPPPAKKKPPPAKPATVTSFKRARAK